MSHEQFTYNSFLDLTKAVSVDYLQHTSYDTDQRDGSVYVYSQELKLAIEVAMATNRPLLLRGEPGSGKSSLAAFVARNLNWRYYEYIVTARTSARDLLWTFDSLRRLKDAQAKREFNEFRYIEPGVIWWLFDCQSASRRGCSKNEKQSFLSHDFLKNAKQPFPAQEPNAAINIDRSPDGAVLLIDEIDKADPDVPNDLLIPLGSMMFRVDEIGLDIKCENKEVMVNGKKIPTNHLIIITTNEERELPQAFLRRCVIFQLKHPERDQIIKIAKCHFGKSRKLSNSDCELIEKIAERLEIHRNQAQNSGRRKPSTAEYLDAVRACFRLNIQADDSMEWETLASFILKKSSGLEE